MDCEIDVGLPKSLDDLQEKFLVEFHLHNGGSREIPVHDSDVDRPFSEFMQVDQGRLTMIEAFVVRHDFTDNLDGLLGFGGGRVHFEVDQILGPDEISAGDIDDRAIGEVGVRNHEKLAVEQGQGGRTQAKRLDASFVGSGIDQVAQGKGLVDDEHRGTEDVFDRVLRS